MNLVTEHNVRHAGLALKADGVQSTPETEYFYNETRNHLASMIGEVHTHFPTAQLFIHEGEFAVLASNGFVIAKGQNARDAWEEAYREWSACPVA